MTRLESRIENKKNKKKNGLGSKYYIYNFFYILGMLDVYASPVLFYSFRRDFTKKHLTFQLIWVNRGNFLGSVKEILLDEGLPRDALERFLLKIRVRSSERLPKFLVETFNSDAYSWLNCEDF